MGTGVARRLEPATSQGARTPNEAPPQRHDITSMEGLGMAEAERERLTVLETQMRELVGNGQPGRIGRIEAKLDSTAKYLYIGIGILGALQFVAPMLLKRLAS